MSATNFTFGDMGACNCPSGPPTLTCSPCAIPKANLTLSWVNVISGNGSTTLTYGGGTSWSAGCVNGLNYLLSCAGGTIVLTVTYFTVGACPTGTTQNCTSSGASPHKLTLSSFTCSPLSMTFASVSANCPVLTGAGYLSFTVTYP